MIPALPEVNTLVRMALGDRIVASRVEGAEDNDLLLAAPEAGVDGPPAGTMITLHWASPRGASSVPVSFVGLERDRVRLWRVRSTGSVELIQRRSFTRAPAEGRAAVVPLRPAITSVRTGWIADLSEAGARCSFPAGQIQMGEEVELHLDIGYVIVVTGRVLRVESTYDGAEEVVVAFDANERVADRLRSYVFSRQRAQRQDSKR